MIEPTLIEPTLIEPRLYKMTKWKLKRWDRNRNDRGQFVSGHSFYKRISRDQNGRFLQQSGGK